VTFATPAGRKADAVPRRTLLWLLLLPLAGCAEGSNPSPAPRVTLFKRLGEKPGLKRLIDDTADRLPDSVKQRWSKDLTALKEALAEELGAELGGPAVAEKNPSARLEIRGSDVPPLTEAFEQALPGEKDLDPAYRGRVLLRFKAVLAELVKRAAPPAKPAPN
jgi:hypothetical protein